MPGDSNGHVRNWQWDNDDHVAGRDALTGRKMADNPKRIIVWFRGDLRVHDHPALAVACSEAGTVLPLFILDPNFLKKSVGSNRNRFLLESLQDLRRSLKKRGGDLFLANGNPETVLPKVAEQWNADAVYYISDYSPYSVKRDKTIQAHLSKSGIGFKGFGGKLLADGSTKLTTKTGNRFIVFTPFWRAWLEAPRRDVVPAPKRIRCDAILPTGALPDLDTITNKNDLSPEALPGGETEARKRLHEFIDTKLDKYHQDETDMGKLQTSLLSAYFHFGCISAREAESLVPDTKGGRAWTRQLCWRDFYHYVLLHNPHTVGSAFQEKLDAITWDDNPDHFTAWTSGTTGYPAVDAGMRELIRTGFMHNRARMIVGSFLTKHLWTDWRKGQDYFMTMLVDGDTANNVGNWQWIAGVGVDPAPFYRRLYNPTLQAQRLDPSGMYIRTNVPELANVPDKYIYEPWTMPEEVQAESKCIIGKDYPAPIVDHATARKYALEKFNAARD